MVSPINQLSFNDYKKRVSNKSIVSIAKNKNPLTYSIYNQKSSNISFGYKLRGDINSHLDYLGANKHSNGTTSFRVYSTKPNIELEIAQFDHEIPYWQDIDEKTKEKIGLKTYPMDKSQSTGGFVFSVTPKDKLPDGTLYRFKITNEDGSISYVKDPRSYFQPHDTMGWSAIYDQNNYKWHDDKWMTNQDERRITHNPSRAHWGIKGNMIISEKHIGLLGGYKKAKEEIEKIAKDGICNTVYVLPLGEFFGPYNHGYDEVDKFAPESSYGNPDELKALIDFAHSKGINMMLDVVPNHFGFIGNPVGQFAPAFDSNKDTGWGSALLFNGETGFYMRKYMSDMMINWLTNYHFDGLRIDATEKLESDPTLKYIAAEIRNHPETRHAVLLPEHLDKTRKLAQPLTKTEIKDPLATYNTASIENLAADRLGFDVQYAYDFKNTLSALTLGMQIYDCPSSIEDLASEYLRGNRFFDETSAHLGNLKANNTYVYYNMHDEYNAFGGTRPVVRLLAKQLGLIKETALTNPDGLDKTPFFEAEKLLDDYLEGNYSSSKIPLETFIDAYKKAKAQNRLLIAATFMHPAIKGFSMGDERGELNPLRYFALYDNESTKQALDKQKGYDVGKSAFEKSSKFHNPIVDLDFKRTTTELSSDFTRLIEQNPALKYGDYKKIIAKPIQNHSIFIHRWDGVENDIFAIANFSNQDRSYPEIPLFPDGTWVEVLNTDDKKYGGDGLVNLEKYDRENLKTLPPKVRANSLAVFKRVE